MVKEDKNRNCFGKNATVIATIEAPHTLLTGPPGLIKVKNDVMAMTVLQNCGWFYDMSAPDKLEKLDRKFLSAMTSQININAISENKTRWRN